MGTGYATDIGGHLVKYRVNQDILGGLRGYRSRNALVMPSVTCNDIEICRRCGIFDRRTRFVAVEKGIAGIGRDEFRRMLSERMDDIFGKRRDLGTYCDILHGRIEERASGDQASEREFDFGNIDTCSYFNTVNEWMPHELKSYKPGSPIVMTFDADYTGRIDECRYSWLRHYSCEDSGKVELMHVFGNHDPARLDRTVRRVARLASFLGASGVDVRRVCLYTELKSKNKMMAVLAGVMEG